MQNDVLMNTVIDVFEKQAFAFVDVCSKDELENNSDSHFYTHITFSGPVNGKVGMAIPIHLGEELATSILGIEPGELVNQTDVADALKELLNVTCGQFLTASYGNKPVFHLDIPDCAIQDPSHWQTLCEHSDTIGFVIENTSALAHVFLKENTL